MVSKNKEGSINVSMNYTTSKKRVRYLSLGPKSFRMVIIASLVCSIFLPIIEPLLSMMKTTFLGMIGRSAGAKKCTKYPSRIRSSPPRFSLSTSYLIVIDGLILDICCSFDGVKL